MTFISLVGCKHKTPQLSAHHRQVAHYHGVQFCTWNQTLEL